MTDIEELPTAPARDSSPRTTHALRWSAIVAAVIAAAVITGLAVLLTGGSRSSQPGGARLRPLVTTRMGQLLVRHPAAWLYIQPGPPPLGDGSLFGWLTNAPAHKPCTFGVNEMTCWPPVRSLSSGEALISAGSSIQLAPPLAAAEHRFRFIPNRTVNGHLAELTRDAPGYTSGCPPGATRKLALIIEMGKRPAAYRSGIWYLTACTADPDQTAVAALARMVSTVRVAP